MNEEACVYVVDDDASMRNMLSRLMKSVGLNVECFQDAKEFLSVVNYDRPGCVLADIRMPGMSGIELQRALKEMQNNLPVIFITGHGDVPMAVHSMKSGAVDFFEKPFNDQVLIERVRECMQRSVELQKKFSYHDEIALKFKKLSNRECEVLDMIVAGFFSKAIGSQLGISRKTVDVHRAHIFDKLEVRSVAELVRLDLEVHENRGIMCGGRRLTDGRSQLSL